MSKRPVPTWERMPDPKTIQLIIASVTQCLGAPLTRVVSPENNLFEQACIFFFKKNVCISTHSKNTSRSVTSLMATADQKAYPDDEKTNGKIVSVYFVLKAH